MAEPTRTYVYRCEAGHVTRIRQETPTGCIRCPECGRDAVRSYPRTGER